jgi:hypothetical protein
MARSPFTYRVSSNGTADDWYWEVASAGGIIGRGFAATEVKARVAATATALSYELYLAADSQSGNATAM